MKPSSGSLAARDAPYGSTQSVRVEYAATAVGSHSAQAQVIVNGAEASTITLMASSEIQRLRFVPLKGAGEADHFDLGCLYYLTSRGQSAILHNDGPMPISYVVVPEQLEVWRHTDTARVVDTASSVVDVVQVEPNEGYLRPQERVKVNFIFSPTLEDRQLGWSQEVTCR